MDLLLTTDEKSHQRLYVSKILTDLFIIRQKIRIKNTSADIAYNVLEVKRSCKNEHKKVCLKKNDNQGIKLRSSSINFKKLFQTVSCAI